jgi:hypothetical protein
MHIIMQVSSNTNLFRLIICGFTFRSRIFYLYGDVTVADERLQNLNLCSALKVFEQGGIFIVPHLLRHGASVSTVSSEGPPHLVASYDTQGGGGGVEDLFQPGSSQNYYFKLNWTLKCDHLEHVKNLDVSQLRRYLREQRTITLRERLIKDPSKVK